MGHLNGTLFQSRASDGVTPHSVTVSTHRGSCTAETMNSGGWGAGCYLKVQLMNEGGASVVGTGHVLCFQSNARVFFSMLCDILEDMLTWLMGDCASILTADRLFTL